MIKINSKTKFPSIPWLLIFILLTALLIYTRFINLGWGLPYPMHPDERNMVNAVTQLSCQLPSITLNLPKSISEPWNIFNWVNISKFDIETCFNPHFFAYGQFPLYLGFIIISIYKLIFQLTSLPISFEEGAMSLRFISAIASILTAFYSLRIVTLIFKKENFERIILPLAFLIIIFSPYAIQFSHFGTTESLLMFFYILIIYQSILFSENLVTKLNYVFTTAFIMGISFATKVSSLIFATLPLMVLLMHKNKLPEKKLVTLTKSSTSLFLYRFFNKFADLFVFGMIAVLFFILFSPHNLISLNSFLGSISYEKEVALGSYIAFYTRQFVGSVPILFQTKNIFPYVLGWWQFIFFILGFLFLSWRNKNVNILRFAFLIYFLPNALMFAKWTRFMAPIFPLMTVVAVLFLANLYKILLNKKLNRLFINTVTIILMLIVITPGIAYLSIYQNPDVRFQASDWIYKNIPENSYILSETANVVDIPMGIPNMKYRVISFNFYDLDTDKNLQSELKNHLLNADYIFVPSRRIFANLKDNYPMLNQYYQDLSNGTLGFTKIAEFNSFPEIKLALPGILQKFSFKFNDEKAEETWTVFDHPVIRIYKKSSL